MLSFVNQREAICTGELCEYVNQHLCQHFTENTDKQSGGLLLIFTGPEQKTMYSYCKDSRKQCSIYTRWLTSRNGKTLSEKRRMEKSWDPAGVEWMILIYSSKVKLDRFHCAAKHCTTDLISLLFLINIKALAVSKSHMGS